MATNDYHIRKIVAGYYSGSYRGHAFNIVKVEGKNQWYWIILNKGGEDWFPKKSIAISAVKEFIDSL